MYLPLNSIQVNFVIYTVPVAGLKVLILRGWISSLTENKYVCGKMEVHRAFKEIFRPLAALGKPPKYLTLTSMFASQPRSASFFRFLYKSEKDFVFIKIECEDMRKLIINADDFGLTTGVNSAISECAKRGVLRSATIMANGPAFDDAVRTGKDTADLGIGIHFVLTGLKPLSSPETIPELAGRTGILPSSPWELLKTVFTKKGVREEIQKELLAQTEKVFDSGITPTHFDTHKHVHIIPAVLDVLLEIANRFSVNWIRNPFDSPGAWRFLFDIEKDRRGEFLKQYGNVLCSRVSRHSFMSRVRGSGVRTPQSFHGVSVTGIMNEKVLARMAGNLEPGISELMTHPGILDTDLAQQKTRLLRSREVEKDLLLSETVKRAFDNKGIVLSNFGEVNL